MLWKGLVMMLVICLHGQGFGADIVFKCPDPFLEDKVNSLTVEINKTAVDKAKCAVKPQQLYFGRKRVIDNPKASSAFLCNTDYRCSVIEPVSQPTHQKATCGCVKSKDNIVTFEVKLYVNKKNDTGANYTYQFCASPEHQLSKSIQNSCTFASIDTDDNGCDTGCIVAIVVGVVVILALLTFGILCFARNKKKGHIPVPT